MTSAVSWSESYGRCSPLDERWFGLTGSMRLSSHRIHCAKRGSDCPEPGPGRSPSSTTPERAGQPRSASGRSTSRSRKSVDTPDVLHAHDVCGWFRICTRSLL